MAKTKKAKVAEKTTDNKVEGLKVKAKPTTMKKLGNEDDTVKVNLNQEEKPVEETQVEEQPKEENNNVVEEVKEEVENKEVETKEENNETPVLEEVAEETTDEVVEDKAETIEEAVEEAVAEAKETGKKLPENIQKVVDFMEETGGDLEDYVKLNQDYTKLDDTSMLHEYYRQTKPHLTQDERNFLVQDSFSYDAEVDEELDIKRKKLAFKEQVAAARSHMDSMKSTYYKEIKSGVKLTPEQQKAVDFFGRYNKETEESKKIADKQSSMFLNKTNQVFNDSFKGFEYKVGDKKYRFNINDVNKTKETQSDINNFVGKFLDKKTQLMSDANGYHKSLFTAMNADAIADHFYQQGKADAVKDTMAKAKNVDMSSRETGSVEVGGNKFKVLGDNAQGLKFKINK
tara:strand:+ start:2091 stop:3293 length:1203 start_codon:yes stop_codon:yes gene_type:complete